MNQERKSAILLLEGWLPFVAAVGTFIALFYWRVKIASYFGVGGWNLENLFAAVFDWASIQTGFLFGVYGFVVANSDGFIERVRGTMAMRRFTSYTFRATSLGFALTVASMPLIIISPKITDSSSYWFLVVILWFAAFIWAFLAFLRVAYIFGLIARVKRNEFIGA